MDVSKSSFIILIACFDFFLEFYLEKNSKDRQFRDQLTQCFHLKTIYLIC